jgi:hypothetical protein
MICVSIIKISFQIKISKKEANSWEGEEQSPEFAVFHSFALKKFIKCIQQFASKHKPQTFSRVCLRLKRDVYRWKRNVSLLM